MLAQGRLRLEQLESRTVPAATLPRDLLIYYGYPSLINDANGSVSAAVSQFQRYQVVVLGDTLEFPNHEDHAKTQQIVNSIAPATTLFFGYIPLGNLGGGGLSESEIQSRVAQWKATGVDGILFDEFGYDFAVSRARQNVAVNAAHAQNLPVIANGYFPDDVFGSQIDAQRNPTGAVTALGAIDYYLAESYQIKEGAYDSEPFWQTRAAALRQYQQQLQFRVLSVTTPDAAGHFTDVLMSYAYRSAVLDGHHAFGWGELDFSAESSEALFRQRPAVDPNASALVVNGTAGNDVLTIGPTSALGSLLTVTLNSQVISNTVDPSRPITVDLGAGNDRLTVQSGVFGRITASGGAGDDVLLGGFGADTLSGGGGADTVAGGIGDDNYAVNPNGAWTVTETFGSDTLDFSTSGLPVTVDLDRTDRQTLTDRGDTLTITGTVENGIGSPFSDTVRVAALGVPRTVDGGLPGAGVPPGDTLFVNCSGKAGSDTGSKVQVPGLADVNYRGMEQVWLTNTGVPTVLTVRVNDSQVQRSRVTSLQVTFNSVVTIAPGAFTLTYIGAPASGNTGGVVGSTVGSIAVSTATASGVTVATLTFSGADTFGGSLIDGRYSLKVDRMKVTASGVTMAADFTYADGINGASLYRLYGDANGDRVVNGSDLTPFIQQFGGPNPTFDFNADGVVNGADVTEFVKRFGLGV